VGVLQRFERRLEGLVQGAFTRAFGGWVEPVEVAAALTREAQDRKTIVAAGRVLVPNSYVVELGSSDADRLRDYDEPLRAELAAMLEEDAKEHGWSFVGPVEVAFQETAELDTGAFRIRSAVVRGEAQAEVEPSTTTLGDRPLREGTTVIGRGAEVDVQLTDTGVSRRHAEVTVGAAGIRITDLGSTNGTYVNGIRVTTTTLNDGDLVTVGGTDLVLRTGAA